jgi:hypothetical protein
VNNTRIDIIERFTNPSKHVQEPYGSIWKNGDSYFLQTSLDPENSNWVAMGKVLVTIYQDRFSSKVFIDDILSVYEDKISQLGSTSIEFEQGV